MKIAEKISVIIPTHKHTSRDSDLSDLISSLLVDSNVKCIGEIIIVDNGNSLLELNPILKDEKIKIVAEPKIGLNYARNTGIRNARYDLVAFLDDDIIASPNWAENIVGGYYHQEILCVGGPVLIKTKPKEYPNWFSNYFLRFLMPPEFPNKSGIIQAPYYLIGANMSFKKEVFDIYGFFDHNLDRKGKNLLSNGDIELIMRIPNAKVWYQSAAIVYEKVPEHRITRCFMMRRLFWQGVSDFIMIKKNGFDGFYDKDEIIFNTNFLKKISSAFLHFRFFESLCMVVRKLGFFYGKIYLKVNQETDIVSIS
jgi:glycosyltransferase involved in cell wall biosynthesis